MRGGHRGHGGGSDSSRRRARGGGLSSPVAGGGRAGRPRRVSTRIQYPLTAFAADIRIAIPDAAAFLENYDVVFSPGLKAVIAQAAIAVGGRSAPAAPVAVTADAMTIG